MAKFLLALCFLGFSLLTASAQTFNDADREGFMDAMNAYDKAQENVQKCPEYKGGYGALYDFLQSQIHYPEKARKEQLSARVLVSCFINWKTGLPTEVKVKDSSNDVFNKEAIRILKLMPAWAPGRMQDNFVSLNVLIPVYFHLR